MASVEHKGTFQVSGYDCGPAIVHTVLRSLGTRPPDLCQLGQELFTTPEAGTSPDNIIAYLRHKGRGIITGWPMRIQDLADHTRAGRLVICLTNYGGGHYVSVNRVEQVGRRKIVHFFCPYHDETGGQQVESAVRFEKNWHARGMSGVNYERYGIAVE